MIAKSEEKQQSIFKLKGISKSFDGLQALENVDLDICHGERHAIIGPNGAGKTTLFNVISGELAPDSGEIQFYSRLLNKYPTRKRIQMGLGRTYQITNLFQELTAEENIFLAVNGSDKKALGLFKPWRGQREKVNRVLNIAQEIGLQKEHLQTPVKELSYGDQRKLDLSLAISGNPKLLLLDEPMAGLARAERPQIAGLIKSLDPNIAVIVIEHDIEVAFGIVENVTVLHMGRIIAQGDPETIRSNSEVRELYMGA
jgi:branched-chain amino acid transport system ATP-binding protein